VATATARQARRRRREAARRGERLHESNPDLGLRGVRLGLVTRAFRAAGARDRRGDLRAARGGAHARVEIMVPLIGSVRELHLVRDEAEEIMRGSRRGRVGRLEIRIGTMIELPGRRSPRTASPTRRLLLLRHQRPDQTTWALARRRRGHPVRRVPGEGRLHGVPVRDDRPGRRRRLVRIAVEEGPRHEARPEARRVR